MARFIKVVYTGYLKVEETDIPNCFFFGDDGNEVPAKSYGEVADSHQQHWGGGDYEMSEGVNWDYPVSMTAKVMPEDFDPHDQQPTPK